MPNLNIWVAESLSEILSTQPETAEIVTKIINFFKSQYENANIDEIKSSADEINEILEEKGFAKLISIQKSWSYSSYDICIFLDFIHFNIPNNSFTCPTVSLACSRALSVP